MCTDVAWSRQREQIQTEEMSHILLRPEFSSPRLEAISISWPTSYKSRWQLMPTKLSHTKACFLVFSISGKNVIKTKTMKLKGIMLLVVCFFGDFFFSTRKAISSYYFIMIWHHNLCDFISSRSPPSYSRHIGCTLSQTSSVFRLQGFYPWLHLEFYPQGLVPTHSSVVCSKVTSLEIISQTILYKIVILQYSPFPYPITLLYFFLPNTYHVTWQLSVFLLIYSSVIQAPQGQVLYVFSLLFNFKCWYTIGIQ